MSGIFTTKLWNDKMKIVYDIKTDKRNRQRININVSLEATPKKLLKTIVKNKALASVYFEIIMKKLGHQIKKTVATKKNRGKIIVFLTLRNFNNTVIFKSQFRDFKNKEHLKEMKREIKEELKESIFKKVEK